MGDVYSHGRFKWEELLDLKFGRFILLQCSESPSFIPRAAIQTCNILRRILNVAVQSGLK